MIAYGAIASIIGRKKRSRLLSGLKEDSNLLGSLNWQEFELLVGEAFRQKGFQVIETGKGGADGGVDLVLSKDSLKYLVQCKHWKSGKVPVTVVRELLGVIVSQAAVGGFVVASDGFTKEAWSFAKDNRITLIGREELTRMIKGAQEASHIQPVCNGNQTNSNCAIPSCPTCGAGMRKRVAKNGANAGNEFWGCSRFPKCRGTMPL